MLADCLTQGGRIDREIGESASDLRVRIARPTGECRAGASGIGRSFASLVLKRSNCLAPIERLRGSGRARRHAPMRCDLEEIDIAECRDRAGPYQEIYVVAAQLKHNIVLTHTTT